MTLIARIWLVALFGALLGAAQAQTLRWAARGDTRTMDPHGFVEGVTHNLNSLVYDALVERDVRENVVPSLAIRWSQPDRLTWRFTLRPDVKFHDGSPLTAADVVFSIQRAQRPESPFSTFARPMGSPVAIDASTVELRLTRPNPLLLRHASVILIMSRDWATAHQVERVPAASAREQAWTTLHAMGTGRFVLKERQPGARIVLERHRGWWGTFEGNVAEVVYLPIENDATRTAAFLSGSVDFMQDVPPQDVDRIAATPSLRLVTGVENRLIAFGFDQSRDELRYASVRGRNPFKDVRVREAFFRAINAEALKTSIMRGQALPTGCLAVAASGCMAPELEARSTIDLPRARELMASAGYADGFEVTLDCPNDRYVNDRQLCVALVGMLARIGVKLKVEAQPKTQHFTRMVAHDTSFFMVSWGGLHPDSQPILDALAHSVDAPQSKGNGNPGQLSDAELDRLIDAAAVESDIEVRQALIRDAQRRIAENYYFIPLHRQMLMWATRGNVRTVVTADNLVRADWVRID